MSRNVGSPLDQEIEGSNPSSPAIPQHLVAPYWPLGQKLWIAQRS
jgi:hypothetical protein